MALAAYKNGIFYQNLHCYFSLLSLLKEMNSMQPITRSTDDDTLYQLVLSHLLSNFLFPILGGGETLEGISSAENKG